jgi:signal transduction histidine kinase
VRLIDVFADRDPGRTRGTSCGVAVLPGRDGHGCGRIAGVNDRSRFQPSRYSLRVRLTALLVAASVLLTAIAVIGAVAAHANRDAVDAVFNDVSPLRNDSQALQVALLDQETGVRGYAIDGSQASLNPYTTGYAQQQQLIADMRAHIGEHPAVAADLDRLQAAIDAWRAQVAAPVIATVSAGHTDSALSQLNAAGTTQFDTIRANMATLQTDVLALRDVAVEHLLQSSRQMLYDLIAAAVIVLLTALLLWWAILRLVTRPIHRLAESVQVVAGGDFEHEVDMSGPLELALLGRDVDDMRRKIVDDLHMVQIANESVAEINAQLEQRAAELVRSNEDLEQFAYVASHDLQEPLRKVASFCQLLQRRYAGRLDERADQYISFAVDGAHRMQRLIDDLLEFSRIGRTGSEPGPVRLDEVAAEAAATIRTALNLTGGEITIADMPVVTGDRSLLTMLFTNLVGNSMKFRRDTVPVRIALTARPVGMFWEISCTDNGIGIEPEHADRIFTIFQRLHTRDVYPGTGIGLAIAKRIVDHHGGRIWVDTEASGDGTVFRFTLPAAAAGTIEKAPEIEAATTSA